MTNRSTKWMVGLWDDDIKSNIKYDVLKYGLLVAWGLIAPIVLGLYQKVRHVSLDWFALILVFLVSLLIIIVGSRKLGNLVHAAEGAVAPATSQAITAPPAPQQFQS